MNVGTNGSKRRRDEFVIPAEQCCGLTDTFLTAVVAFMIAAVMGLAGAAAPGEPTLVYVKKKQTLNEAMADVEGPMRVILPEGVTEHTKVITRAAIVNVKGQREQAFRHRRNQLDKRIRVGR